MAITITHPFVSAKPDGGDASIVQPSNWNDDHTLVGTLPVANGGTAATTAADARTNLGVGTIATQNSNSVSITGGSIAGVTITSLDANTTFQDNADPTKQMQFQLSGITGGQTSVLTVPDTDGTLLLDGATASSLVITSADINGGTVDATVIGGGTPAAGTFTTLASTGNTTLGDASGDTVTVNAGTVNLAATGARITGDFSNATVANRLMFQASTVNGVTQVAAIPNGSATNARFQAVNASDPTNSSIGELACNSTSVAVISGITGTGTYLPMTFYTGGSERMRIDTSGNVTVTNAGGGLGYGTGAGGTVTQATSRTTAVTLNKPTGAITMFTAAGSATWARFTLSNSLIAANDLVVCQVNGAPSNNYQVFANGCTAGSCWINFVSVSGTASDTPVINFAIIKAVTS